ncbi:TIGR02234 family membrane protein [Streptomyces sp. NPDC047000]|uniref:TIGR02234 family membrane protein n=1 Tax=Streptomyces sp. NPDC047000 TaxID=3155474 RepID=UPI0033D525FF
MGYVTAVPHPRSEAAASAGPARSGRRSLAAALLLGALGAAVALLASRQRWSHGTATVAGGTFPLTARGSDVTGVPAALAIVGLAALVAVFAVRRSGRLLVSALLALSGAGTVAAALAGAHDRSALDEQAAKATGDTAAAVHALSHTAWPYAAAAGGLLILLAGLLALRYGRLWPAMSGRYEREDTARPRRAAPSADPGRPEDLWKALDRGEDPTGADPA